MEQRNPNFLLLFQKVKNKLGKLIIMTITDGKTLLVDKPLAYLSRKIVSLNDICSRHICNKRKIKVILEVFSQNS